MPFVRRLTSNSTSATVISALKQMFGEHGIPHKLLSDKGPQYDCIELRTFAADRGFRHITGSPRYPQYNGFAERMVQTIKKTMLKARQSDTDPDLSLLCPRTNPIDNNLPSPAELLCSRQLRSNVSLLSSHTPKDKAVQQNLQVRQQRRKKYLDRSARDLSPLHTSQRIHLQKANGTWTPATVVEKKSEPPSHTVRTPNCGLYTAVTVASFGT